MIDDLINLLKMLEFTSTCVKDGYMYNYDDVDNMTYNFWFFNDNGNTYIVFSKLYKGVHLRNHYISEENAIILIKETFKHKLRQHKINKLL